MFAVHKTMTVSSFGGLEVSDVCSDTIEVLQLHYVGLDEVVCTIQLIHSDEIVIVNGGQGLVLLHWRHDVVKHLCVCVCMYVCVYVC